MSETADNESRPEIDPELLERRDAALAQIIQFGDPVLNSRASPATEFSESLRTDSERMISIMRDAMGVGLAATQLGILRRLLVFQAGPDAEPAVIVNPEVAWLSEEAAVAEEGCLSIPRVSVDVSRPLFVRVSGFDIGGQQVRIEAAGLEARVLQHEIDHLDGVLILDRTTREQRRAAMRALRDGEAYSPAGEGEEGAGSEAGAAAKA